MATLAELDAITGDPGWEILVGKVRVALVIKAYDLTELVTPTTEQLAYALQVFNNPSDEARVVTYYIVAANNGVSVANILAASDNAIQSNVDSAVDNLFAA